MPLKSHCQAICNTAWQMHQPLSMQMMLALGGFHPSGKKPKPKPTLGMVGSGLQASAAHGLQLCPEDPCRGTTSHGRIRCVWPLDLLLHCHHLLHVDHPLAGCFCYMLTLVQTLHF